MVHNFVAGDVVILKSDGPDMTVESIGTEYGTPVVTCVWFEKNQAKRMRFSPAALKKSPDSSYVG